MSLFKDLFKKQPGREEVKIFEPKNRPEDPLVVEVLPRLKNLANEWELNHQVAPLMPNNLYSPPFNRCTIVSDLPSNFLPSHQALAEIWPFNNTVPLRIHISFPPLENLRTPDDNFYVDILQDRSPDVSLKMPFPLISDSYALSLSNSEVRFIKDGQQILQRLPDSGKKYWKDIIDLLESLKDQAKPGYLNKGD